MKRSAILSAVLVVFRIAAPAQTARSSPTVADVEAVLAKVATYQYGGDPAPAVTLDEMIGRMSGSAESRKAIEALLLKHVQSNATNAGKEPAFRQLSLVGSAASVPVLAPMLNEIDTAEMARYALTAIPGPAVDEALRTALEKASSDRIRVGLINSLGARKDSRSVGMLADLVSPANPEVSAAALAALANIADRQAVDAIAAARKKNTGRTREFASESFVVAADQLASRGDRQGAAGVYKQLLALDEAATVRARALKGLAAADPNGATPVLIAELQSGSPDREVTAIRLLNGMPGSAATKALLAGYSKMSTVAKVHLLTALAGRRDPAARELVGSAAGDTTPAIRGAALAALGSLGDDSSIKVLAEAAASGKEPEQSAARRSLSTIRGAGVDAAIVSAMNSSSGKMKSELIAAVGERAAATAADALMKAAQEPDTDVRREALRALRNVGGSAQTQTLLDVLLKASSAGERREATQTLATVLRRTEAGSIKSVMASYQSAPSREAKLSLLEVMGQVSSDETLPLLLETMKSSDPEAARGAILALTAWDNVKPLPELLAFAKSARRPTATEGSAPADPAAGGPPRRPGGGQGGLGGGGRGLAPPTNNLQVLALRGVLRLMVLQSNRSPAESGRLLGEVMSLSSMVPEKRTVLSLLSYFPSKESLVVAEAAVNDPSVTNEAKVALDQVVEGMKVK